MLMEMEPTHPSAMPRQLSPYPTLCPAVAIASGAHDELDIADGSADANSARVNVNRR